MRCINLIVKSSPRSQHRPWLSRRSSALPRLIPLGRARAQGARARPTA